MCVAVMLPPLLLAEQPRGSLRGSQQHSVGAWLSVALLVGPGGGGRVAVLENDVHGLQLPPLGQHHGPALRGMAWISRTAGMSITQPESPLACIVRRRSRDPLLAGGRRAAAHLPLARQQLLAVPLGKRNVLACRAGR